MAVMLVVGQVHRWPAWTAGTNTTMSGQEGLGKLVLHSYYIYFTLLTRENIICRDEDLV